MENVLIKASGDVTDNYAFFNFVVKMAMKNYTAVICGF
jgi:hypothetical protein